MCRVVTADLKVFALSDIILEGTPLLAVKRLKLLRKLVAVMSGTKSRSTALIAQHVYRHSHTVVVPSTFNDLTCKGPAKSNPVV